MRAFSLLELLLTLSIISILCALSYPSYQHLLAVTKRHQAQAVLLVLANRLEVFHSQENSFEKAAITKLLPHNAAQLPFTFQLSNAGQFTYRITAVANPLQQQQDEQCLWFAVNEIGQRFASHQQCWH